MKLLVFAGLFAVVGFPAFAVTPVTYTFKGLVEYGYSPATVPINNNMGTPPSGAKLGEVVVVLITVDSSAPRTLNGNTAYYYGGDICDYPTPSPIISVTINKKRFSTVNFGNGECDEIAISNITGGQYSITMFSRSLQIGETFAATFTTMSSTAFASLAIPRSINTNNFQRSTFFLGLPAGYLTISGDVVTN